MVTAYNYADLQGYWRKGLRNGNWRKLNPLKKGLYMAARWYARGKGELLSGRLVAMLEGIMARRSRLYSLAGGYELSKGDGSKKN